MGIKKLPSFPWGRFTLIELLIVISIIAILASLLLPALHSARERTKSILCSSNQKQLARAILAYTDDFNGYFPPLWGTQCWWDEIAPYVGAPTARSPLLFCPSESYSGGGRGPVTGMNIYLRDSATSTATLYNGSKSTKVSNPSEALLTSDGYYWPAWGNSSNVISSIFEERGGIKYRHQGNANASFIDGHIERFKIYISIDLLNFW